MPIRKGIVDVSGNYAAPIDITCLVHTCTLYLKKLKGRQNRILYIFFNSTTIRRGVLISG